MKQLKLNVTAIASKIKGVRTEEVANSISALHRDYLNSRKKAYALSPSPLHSSTKAQLTFPSLHLKGESGSNQFDLKISEDLKGDHSNGILAVSKGGFTLGSKSLKPIYNNLRQQRNDGTSFVPINYNVNSFTTKNNSFAMHHKSIT